MKHGDLVVCASVIAAGVLLNGDVNAGSLEPPGPPAPTMKTIQETEPRTPITSLPFTISAPGSYYLTGHLTGVSGASGITINSSYVTLDLSGFSLIGVSGSLDGIRIPSARLVTIRNGVIRSWGGSGISAGLSPEITVEDLRAHVNGGDGIRIGTRSFVRRVVAVQNAGPAGIFVDGGTMVVESAAHANFQSAIVLLGSSTITASVATWSPGNGFNLGEGSVAIGCTAFNNTTNFALGSGSRVVDSTTKLGTDGFVGADGVSIEECSAYSHTGDGIRVNSRSVVRRNVVHLAQSDGIEATGASNVIEENQAIQNGVGIRTVGSGNLVVKNSAVNNTSEYVMAGGTKLGPISVDPATAGPWANFDL